MSEPSPEQVSSSRRKLLAIIAVAFVPLFIAYTLFFFFPSFAPDGTTNQGQLVDPPVEAATVHPALPATRHWELVIPVESTCDSDCEELLYLSRQVIAGLGKDADRVHRTLLLGTEATPEFRALLDEEHGDMRRLHADTGELLSVDDARPLIFLMDPNGNIMMFYRLDQAGKPMQKDLKHLLKISNIG